MELTSSQEEGDAGRLPLLSTIAEQLRFWEEVDGLEIERMKM